MTAAIAHRARNLTRLVADRAAVRPGHHAFHLPAHPWLAVTRSPASSSAALPSDGSCF